jgi:hypothetical protein
LKSPPFGQKSGIFSIFKQALGVEHTEENLGGAYENSIGG